MPNRVDFDELERLEAELGPTLRATLRGDTPRPGFAESLRRQLNALPLEPARRRARLTLVGRRVWAGLAAIVVIGLASSVALMASRPQPASAEEVMSQVQAEAVTMLSTGGAPCGGGGPGSGDVSVAITHAAGGGPIAPGTTGPVSIQGTTPGSPTDLSDRLAAALGVSGDKVRQAMIDTVKAQMPASLPPDPVADIADQLGLPREQVCSAMFDPQNGIGGFVVHYGTGPAGAQKGARGNELQLAGGQPGGQSPIDLNTATPEQLAGAAKALGVTPERLAAAVKATLSKPMPTPPTPPSEDEIIARFAQNLGMSTDKVKAAITQVEGPNQFYFFAVPVFGNH
jgi:hypothetical protein